MIINNWAIALMMRKIFNIIFLLGLFAANHAMALPTEWQVLAPGLEYTKIDLFPGLPSKGLHAFRFDLRQYQLQLAFTKDYSNVIPTVTYLVQANKAVIGVNGGFFSPEAKPLGLRITNGAMINPLKPTSWWGVFYTQNNRAYIVPPKSFRSNKTIDFAVQSGPRLLINSQIPTFKPGVANRSALGITKDGKVILVATDFPLSMDELAQAMQKSSGDGGLGCINALNLDGGSSTQLYARLKSFILEIPSYAVVTDAVLVVPKKQN